MHVALPALEDIDVEHVAAFFALIRSVHTIPVVVVAIVAIAKAPYRGNLSCLSGESTLTVSDGLSTRNQARFIPLRTLAVLPGLNAAHVTELGFAQAAAANQYHSFATIRRRFLILRHVIAAVVQFDHARAIRTSSPSFTLSKIEHFLGRFVGCASALMWLVFARKTDAGLACWASAHIGVPVGMIDVRRAGWDAAIRTTWITKLFALGFEFGSELFTEKDLNVVVGYGLTAATRWVQALIVSGTAKKAGQALVAVVVLTLDL